MYGLRWFQRWFATMVTRLLGAFSGWSWSPHHEPRKINKATVIREMLFKLFQVSHCCFERVLREPTYRQICNFKSICFPDPWWKWCLIIVLICRSSICFSIGWQKQLINCKLVGFYRDSFMNPKHRALCIRIMRCHIPDGLNDINYPLESGPELSTWWNATKICWLSSFLGGQTGAYCCLPKANTLSVEEVLEDGKFVKNRVWFVLRQFVGSFLSLNKSWFSITCWWNILKNLVSDIKKANLSYTYYQTWMKREEYIPAFGWNQAPENKRKSTGHGSVCEQQNPSVLVTSVRRVHMVRKDIPIFCPESQSERGIWWVSWKKRVIIFAMMDPLS